MTNALAPIKGSDPHELPALQPTAATVGRSDQPLSPDDTIAAASGGVTLGSKGLCLVASFPFPTTKDLKKGTKFFLPTSAKPTKLQGASCSRHHYPETLTALTRHLFP